MIRNNSELISLLTEMLFLAQTAKYVLFLLLYIYYIMFFLANLFFGGTSFKLLSTSYNEGYHLTKSENYLKYFKLKKIKYD